MFRINFTAVLPAFQHWLSQPDEDEMVIPLDFEAATEEDIEYIDAGDDIAYYSDFFNAIVAGYIVATSTQTEDWALVCTAY